MITKIYKTQIGKYIAEYSDERNDLLVWEEYDADKQEYGDNKTILFSLDTYDESDLTDLILTLTNLKKEVEAESLS